MHQRLSLYTRLMLTKFLSLLAVLLFGAIAAAAQTSSIAGTWVLTKAEKLLPDGTRVSDYGEGPHGLVMFSSDGYYSVQIYRAQRVKFSSGDKLKGTPEEYKEGVFKHQCPLWALYR